MRLAAPGRAIRARYPRTERCRCPPSLPPSATGSSARSRRRRRRRSRRGRRSPPASTCSSPRRRAAARRSPPSCGGSTASSREPADAHAPGLRLAAEGAGLRRRPQPARAAARDRRRPVGRDPHRRHAPARARRDAPHAAGHPHHDARVAVPDPHLAGARDAARRRVGHRRRDPRRGLDQARRAPRAHARAPVRARRPRPPAHRPQRHAEPAGGGRALHGRPAAHGADRRRRHPQAAGPQDPRAGRVDGRARADAGAPTSDSPSGGEATRKSIWPAIYPELLEQVRAHRSTIVFVNSRRGAERLALRLNELAEEEIARAHHGSLAREERTVVEEMLKAGELPCLIATSSLELGIDMGAVDLVLQVESPKSVARGLQRIGRAGHSVGDTSKGRIFPKFRADLLECAVVVKLMREGRIEPTVVPRNALDVLAQQIVAIAASAEPRGRSSRRRALRARHAHALLRRAVARPARERPRHARRALSLARVRRAAPAHRVGPRRRDDPRAQGRAPARGDQRRARSPTAACSRSSCPTAGAWASSTRRWSTRRAPGQTFLLGASTWRIEEIGRDRVIVTPGARRARRRAVLEGRQRRAPEGARPRDRRLQPLGGRPARRGARARLRPRRAGRAQPRRLPARAAGRHARRARATARSSSSASATRSATGACASSAPTAGACTPPGASRSSRRIREEYGLESDAIWSDDGIIVHLPDADEPPGAELVLVDPDELEDAVVAELGTSALFGARFRENAARSLLIPRAYPGKRTPLWQQRLKSQSLLEVARALRAVPDRPRDLPRVPARRARPAGADRAAARAAPPRAHRSSRSRRRPPRRSPRALLFDYVATYMYEGDTPNAERRAAALSLDRELLRELLGQEELRELIDPGALRAGRARPPAPLRPHARGLARRAGRRPAPPRRPDRRRGRRPRARRPRRRRRCSAELEARAARRAPARRRRGALDRRRRRRPVPRRLRRRAAQRAARGVHGRRRGAAGEARRALRAHARPVHDRRAARALPRRPDQRPDARWSAPASSCAASCAPAGSEREWCDPEVLRRLRRASLAVLRKEIEAADQRALAAFLPSWQGVDRHPAGRRRRRPPARGARPAAGAGAARRRVGARRPAAPLRRLLADVAGPAVRQRRGRVGRRRRARAATRGRVALYFRDDAEAIGPPPQQVRAAGRRPSTTLLRERLAPGAVLLHRPARRAADSRPSRSRRRCGTSCGPAR